MGALPRHALLALSLPASCAVADVDALVDPHSSGACRERHRTALVGGDVTASPGPLVVGVTAVGSVARRRVLRRDTAQPGTSFTSAERSARLRPGSQRFESELEVPCPTPADPPDFTRVLGQRPRPGPRRLAPASTVALHATGAPSRASRSAPRSAATGRPAPAST